MSERDVQAAIRLALGLEDDVCLWRNSVGVYTEDRNGRRRTIAYGLCPGSADLVGIGPGGRFFALEVKAPGNKATEAQARWLALVRKRGGFAAAVCSTEEAKAALARARNGESS